MGKQSNTGPLLISMNETAVSGWNYLLQKGFFLEGEAGMSVRAFLREALGFSDDYIDGTVRTVFLNNSPVDDIDDTYIKDGDRMALGSAMPGLVGIVMGRDNFYKSFRSGIAVKEAARADSSPAMLSVKVFATLAVESGRSILERGILADPVILAEFLGGKKDQIVEADGADAETFLRRLETMPGKVAVKLAFG